MSKFKYPQPPFKKFVKTENGYIIEVGWRNPEPAEYKKNGEPKPSAGWEICWDGVLHDAVTNKPIGFTRMCDVIVATADTREELL